MKILISNDDGVYSKGISILKKELEKDHEVWVIAPLEERSVSGHALTLDRPLRIVEIGPNVYGCSGYPADCIYLGIGHFFKDDPPDLVISGVNFGANLAQDVYYSGTVAAAREGMFNDINSIAVSCTVDFQNHNPADPIYYETAAVVTKKVIESGILKEVSRPSLLNINVPNLALKDLKGIKLTTSGNRKYSREIIIREDPRHKNYFWISGHYQGHNKIEGTDCLTIDNHYASVNITNVLQKGSDIDSRLVKYLEKL